MNKSLLSAVFNLAVTEQSGQTAVYVTSQAGDRIPSQRFICRTVKADRRSRSIALNTSASSSTLSRIGLRHDRLGSGEWLVQSSG